MKPTPNPLTLRTAIVAISMHTVALAADGVWTNPAGGTWADAANWASSTIADGTGSIADFSTLDLSANTTVNLDGPRTIGSLRLSDTTASHNWTIATGSGGPLTLAYATGIPIILSANGSHTVSAVVAGNQGISKSGSGSLTLSGANTFSGQLLVTQGTVRLGNASALGTGGTTNETIVSAGATLDVNGQALNNTEIFRIVGTGVDANGALVNTGGDQLNALNKLTLTGNASIGGSGRFDLRPGDMPTLDLAGFTLTKTGTNQFSIVGRAYTAEEVTAGTTTPTAVVTAGNVVIDSGIFSVEVQAAMDNNGTVTVNPNGVFGFWGNAANRITRPIVSNGGTIRNLGADATINSPVSIATNTTLTLSGTSYTGWQGVISGTGNLLKTGSGTFDFVNANTFIGKTTITGGYIGLRNENVLGPAPSSFQQDALTIDGGALYTVAGGYFTVNGGPNLTGNRGTTIGSAGAIFDTYGHANQRSRIIVASPIAGPGKLTKNGGGYINFDIASTYSGGTQVNGGPDITDTTPYGAIQISNYGGLGSGPLTFNHTGAINALLFSTSGSLPNDITLPAGNASVTRILANPGQYATLAGVIDGGASSGAKVRFDGGTIILPNTNSYSSDTEVTSGKLVVTGSINASNVSVSSGAAIGGNGSVRHLTLQENSNLYTSTPSLIADQGVVAQKTTNGVNIVVPDTPATPGYYFTEVIGYGSGSTPDLSNFNISAYRDSTLEDDPVGKKINLTYVTDTLTWNLTNGTWDVATSTSWLGGNSLFYQGDSVTFNNPSAASTITLAGTLAPSSTIIDNTNNYTFTGTGSIAGGSLLKSGPGMLVLATANSYPGGTSIYGGTVSLSSTATAAGGSPNALGSGLVDIKTGATLKLWVSTTATTNYPWPILLDGGRILGEDGVNVLNGPIEVTASGGNLSSKWTNKNLVINGEVSGPGKLTIYRETPSGEANTAVIFNRENTYTGGTDIASGVVRVAYSDSALGTGLVTFTGSSTLATDINGGARSLSNEFIINNGVIASLDGGYYPLTIAGNVSGPGTLQLISSGTIALAGYNTYTGGTNINGTGNLRLDSVEALGSTGTITFGGGVLQHTAVNTADYSGRFSTAANQAYKVNTNGQDVIWSSALTSTGGSLTKLGSGTLTVLGPNTYTAGTNVQAGVLEVDLISDTGATSLGTFSTAAASFLSFGGGTLRYTGSFSATTSRNLWNDQVSATIEIVNPGVTLAFTSTAGTLNKPFVKKGAGTVSISDSIEGTATVTVNEGRLNLLGTNTYTGNTTVTDGTLSLATASLADTADVIIGATSTLNLEFSTADSIDQLWIDGVEMAKGTWGSMSSSATYKTPRITGPGTLNVLNGPVGTSAYDAWATLKGLTELNKDPNLDADKDGLTNRDEFALDGNPLSGVNTGKVVSKVATIGGVKVLTLTLPVRKGANFHGNTERVSDPVDGVVYRIQGSETLASFPLEVIEVTGTDAETIQADLPPLSSTDWTYRTFRTAGDITSASKRFLRASISGE